MTEIDNIKEMFEFYKTAKQNKVGFIWVPSFNGWDVYEFDGDKLRSLVNVLSQDFTIKLKEEQE